MPRTLTAAAKRYTFRGDTKPKLHLQLTSRRESNFIVGKTEKLFGQIANY